MNLNRYGYVRVGAAVPEIKIGDPESNREIILKIIKEASNKDINILTFPELSLTGYTCGDIFNQSILLKNVESNLKYIIENNHSGMLISLGLPIRVNNQLFNCAVVFYNNKILGVIPKTFIPNYNEFYEKRWFSSANDISIDKIELCGQTVDFGTNIIFKNVNSDVAVAVEICEDLWVPNPPSINHSLAGANIILNLSASNELVGKHEYRKGLIKQYSASCINAYVYCSAGQTESTTDLVFSGNSIIAENGNILKEDRFNDNSLIYSDIDIESLMNDRIKINSFQGNFKINNYKYINFDMLFNQVNTIERNINSHPFIPNDYNEIFTIQSIGLVQRLKKSGIEKVVLGISGGLDSTLALLVAIKTYEILNLPMKNIIGITMPGFGTTGLTYDNSLKLMNELGITLKEISIKDACIQHFKDIEHDINNLDITYENSQARERTQILMDMANKEKALVIGTGDLSELALGWCTYNGDHMSNYSVNSSIPKTLVKHMVEWYMENTENKNISNILYNIINTPVSPELLPADVNGNIKQKTEDTIGPYELHDFFLYNMIRHGYSPRKIFKLATIAFNNYTEEEILNWMETFYKRFFTQQFKRTCMPPGIKVGSISLSPRGDWRMPDDISYNLWINEIINLKNNRIN